MTLFDTELPDWTSDLLTAATTAGEDVAVALGLSARFGKLLPWPGGGATATRWAVLAEVAARNLTVARVLEAHTDALAIRHEFDPSVPADDRTWGVFAAEAPDARLDAVDGRLNGTKPWCSLAGRLDAALVTAHVDGGRALFEVDLHDPGVKVEPDDAWVARGLRTVTSAPVHFSAVPATQVGDVGWYLRRDGFAWGGLGVAACWLGGAVGLARTLHARSRGRDGELAAAHAGAVDVALHAGESALVRAAHDVDAGRAHGAAGALLALRVRSVVADSVERVLSRVAHALGPAPLAFDPEHAARVADLELYVRQHHAERDLASLGTELFAVDEPW